MFYITSGLKMFCLLLLFAWFFNSSFFNFFAKQVKKYKNSSKASSEQSLSEKEEFCDFFSSLFRSGSS